MATLRMTVIMAIVATFLVAAPAAAGPEDPPVTAVFPDNGATVALSGAGNEVRYTCPEAYRISGEPPFATYGGRKDYGVDFATSPALGSDGRLLQSNVFDRAGPDDIQDNDIPAGQCRGYVRSGIPRVAYWQAWRICIDCGGYETSEVRSMRLTTTGAGLKVTARWPRRAYAGYPFHVSVASTGVGAGSTVELQARRGAGWRRFGSVLLGADAGTGPAALKAGRHRVRAVVRIGDESVVSPIRRLAVVRARRWTTSRRQDGGWRQAGGGTVRFRISGGGRIIKDGVFRQSLLCPTPGQTSPFTTLVADAFLPRTRIAPDGTFAWAGTIKGHAMYIHDKVRGKRAAGAVRMSLRTCTGGSKWNARQR